MRSACLRPGPKAQRSALIVASGKHSGRDAQVQPKREKAPRPDKPSMLSVFEAGDSVEAFLERANEKEEAFANSRGDFSRAVYFDPDNEVVDDPDADADGAALRVSKLRRGRHGRQKLRTGLSHLL